MISPATQQLLAIAMLRGVGPATLRKIATIPQFSDQTIEALSHQVPKLRSALTEPATWRKAKDKSAIQIEEAEKHQVRILSVADSDYPTLLAQSKDDPGLIYVKGQLAAKPEQSVAIIGTREPTRSGLIISARIAQYCAEQQWSVISGLALGCDGAAHRGVVEAGGHTVAVLAHGLQTIAPTTHKGLAEEIIQSGGALITQYPFGQAPLPQLFAQRDKIQAALCRGVLMVQSDLKGGSLIASRAAINSGRWLSVPYPTEEDLAKDEPKIEANKILADGPIDAQLELMKLKSAELLEKIMIIRSRNDYPTWLECMSQNNETPLISVQSKLL